MSISLLPCYKHGCLPSLRVVPLCDTFGQSLKLTKQEYYCKRCEQEALDRSFQGIIDAWNKKQTNPDALKGKYQFTGRDVPIFEKPKEES
jgi:hypothetical protein